MKKKKSLAALALCAFSSTALFANAPAQDAAKAAPAPKATEKAADAQTAQVKVAQASCKGKNTCKGQGNCKTDTHDCKGKNTCKGQGGCKTPDNKAAVAVQTNAEKRANP